MKAKEILKLINEWYGAKMTKERKSKSAWYLNKWYGTDSEGNRIVLVEWENEFEFFSTGKGINEIRLEKKNG